MGVNLSEYKNSLIREDEYKKNRIREVQYFLRGIKFSNIKKYDSKIIDYVTPECSYFFNKELVNRYITEELLIKVKRYYDVLVSKIMTINIDMEFCKNMKDVDEEVSMFVNKIDKEVKLFVDNIRKELEEYKLTIIKQTFINPSDINGRYISIDDHTKYKVKEDNLINMGLNFIKVKVGNNIYEIPKNGREAENDDVVLDDLNTIIVYIYALLSMIKDKKQKKEDFVDFIAENVKVTDPRYFEFLKLQDVFLNIKNYDEFIYEYNKMILKIKKLMSIGNDQEEYTESKNKSRG